MRPRAGDAVDEGFEDAKTAEPVGLLEEAAACDDDGVWGVVDPPDAVVPPFPLTAAQVPVIPNPGAPGLTIVTSGPGSGKTGFVLSTVLQPLLRFATKIVGRDENAMAGAAPEPAAMVTLEQAM